MKTRRVLVLMHAELVPPTSLEGQKSEDIDKWKMEYDVLAALESLGHHAVPLGVEDELRPIRKAIDEHRPHIAFNLLMHFHDAGVYDSALVSWLELIKQPYTGCNPRGLLLAGDKALSKKILSYHRIRVPRFAMFPRGKKVRSIPKRLRFPLFVKSASEHSSTGIAQASIVRDFDALVERVEFVHRNVGTSAIAEEFIQGREVTVGVIGNQRLTTFPPYELHFDTLPEGTANIATSRVKWDRNYQKKLGVRTAPAEFEPAQQREFERLAKRIYRALDLSGYARIDFRLDADGRIWVLEANPNPDLCFGEDFAESAERAGLRYPELVQRIVTLGSSYEPAWKA
ncbi:MAG: ATP-grasp domain-containing protein [Planctomycetes bacterium]|nr:ATP-grasp domain-containing protein [Planctomycetota bacterium]